MAIRSELRPYLLYLDDAARSNLTVDCGPSNELSTPARQIVSMDCTIIRMNVYPTNSLKDDAIDAAFWFMQPKKL